MDSLEPNSRFSRGRELSGLIFLAAALLFGITYYVPSASTGLLGSVFLGLGRGMLGISAFALPALFLYMALEYFFAGSKRFSASRMAHVLILLVLTASLIHAFSLDQADFRQALWTVDEELKATSALKMLWDGGRNSLANPLPADAYAGGLLAGLLALGMQAVAGDTGALVLLIAAVIGELVLLFNFSVSRILGRTGTAVRTAGQMVGTAITQTVQARAERRETSPDFDIDLATGEVLNYRGSVPSAHTPDADDNVLSAYPVSGMPETLTEIAAAEAAAPPSAADQTYIDVATYKPAARRSPAKSDSSVPSRAPGFHDVGRGDPDGKALASDDDIALLSAYPGQAAPAAGSAGRTAEESYIGQIPILSYNPEPERSGLVVGPEPARPAESLGVPEFLRQAADSTRAAAAGTSVPPVHTHQDESWDYPHEEPEAKRPDIRPSQPAAVKSELKEGEIKNRYGGTVDTGRVRALTAEQIEDLEADDTEPEKPYILPSTALLNQDERTNVRANQEQIAAQGRKLEETLKSFGVEAKVINITTGPAITRFELTPGIGVKVSRITNLSDDIALNLAAVGVRIEAPIPGKSAIGIEIPNKKTSVVGLRALIESRDFRESRSRLAVALGRDIPGAPILCDIAKMPHLLIAGATGSGKSVCINSILVSLLYRCNPNELKMLMIDPKVVELSVYNGIPHLLAPVVTDPKKAANTLNWAVVEMNRRYDLFAKKGVRDLASYNTLADREDFEKVPQMIIVIDELADLMLVAPHEVEDSIARLTAMARAAGMHLIIATQRPSVDVITGVIKANIPSRVAFMVSSQVDSRTILDMGGAEKLLGRGDMLYAPQSAPKPVRGQGSFITEEEVERVVRFCKAQNETGYDEELHQEITSAKAAGQGNDKTDDSDQDELFTEAVDIVVDAGYASVSILQRRLNVGYPRAGKLIDAMEQAGYIGPFEGSKPRKLLVTRPQWEQLKMGSDSEDESVD